MSRRMDCDSDGNDEESEGKRVEREREEDELRLLARRYEGFWTFYMKQDAIYIF